MKLIPFTIKIRNNTYNGFLGTSDLSDPPTNFFVFMEGFIVGDLLYRDKWVFNQGTRYRLLNRLNKSECNSIADRLGSIAALGYQSTYLKGALEKVKTTLKGYFSFAIKSRSRSSIVKK